MSKRKKLDTFCNGLSAKRALAVGTVSVIHVQKPLKMLCEWGRLQLPWRRALSEPSQPQWPSENSHFKAALHRQFKRNFCCMCCNQFCHQKFTAILCHRSETLQQQKRWSSLLDFTRQQVPEWFL